MPETLPIVFADRLAFDFDVSDASPVIKGTWVTVAHVVSLITDGHSWPDILRNHPELTEDDVRVAVSYAMSEEAHEDPPRLPPVPDDPPPAAVPDGPSPAALSAIASSLLRAMDDFGLAISNARRGLEEFVRQAAEIPREPPASAGEARAFLYRGTAGTVGGLSAPACPMPGECQPQVATTTYPGPGPWTVAEPIPAGGKIGLTVDDKLRPWAPGDVFVGHVTEQYSLLPGDLVLRQPSTGRIKLDPASPPRRGARR